MNESREEREIVARSESIYSETKEDEESPEHVVE